MFGNYKYIKVICKYIKVISCYIIFYMGYLMVDLLVFIGYIYILVLYFWEKDYE